ncbi:MAG: 2-hydroxyacyl-CoA dehydratase [wastewater metagenome]|nr:2-hydroxyacyl-CoA dehydratase [Candidatus Loosdrechtia aerotolerans]
MAVGETDRKKQRQYFSQQFQNRMRRPRSYPPLGASQARERTVYKLFMESFRDTSAVIWKSTFVPSEIIYALGAVPLYIESFSAVASAVDICPAMLDASEKHGFSRDSCSFLRGVLGASLKGMLPRPDALVSSSYYCDGDPKIFDIFAEKYKKPHFYLQVPFMTDEEWSLDIVAEQLEEITVELARATGRVFSREKLSEIINNSNEACRYFQQAMELRKNVPSPMLGCEAIDYIGSISQLWGSRDFVRISRHLCEELEERVEKGAAAVENEQFRLLWCHLRPYYNDEVFHYLEFQHRAVVAFENINLITWEDMDPQRPFQSLAKKLLTNSGIGSYERMTQWIASLVRDYTIDGVIWMAPWGCRHFNSLSQLVKDGLRKEVDVPFFILDLECIDKRNYSKEQVRTRLDAFIEVLEGRK